jgi:hypothetical protein
MQSPPIPATLSNFRRGEFEGATEVEVTFVSTDSPTLKFGETGESIPSSADDFSLVVNSNVNNITAIGGAMDYYQLSDPIVGSPVGDSLFLIVLLSGLYFLWDRKKKPVKAVKPL